MSEYFERMIIGAEVYLPYTDEEDRNALISRIRKHCRKRDKRMIITETTEHIGEIKIRRLT